MNSDGHVTCGRQTGKTLTQAALLAARVWGPRIEAFFRTLPTQYSFKIMKEQLPEEQRKLYTTYAEHIASAVKAVDGASNFLEDWIGHLRELDDPRRKHDSLYSRKRTSEKWVQEAMEHAAWTCSPALSIFPR